VRMMKSLILACLVPLGFVLAYSRAAELVAAEPSSSLPQATPDRLPLWRGFHLLEKFNRPRNTGGFRESDFQIIHQLGFNFVRLPMDYRTWIVDDDWTQFDEQSLREIDQAVAWGEQYDIHVMLNFHRAPGYTVARPGERLSLWTDAEAQRVCAMHWAMFAKRYRGIPNERLSFNLLNEPAGVEPEVYLRAIEPIVAAIRAEDPERLIVSDGLQWGQQPVLELADWRVAQATRGYTPMDISHYQASWVSGADRYPTPTWPRVQAYGTLYAPNKAGMSPGSIAPLILHGPFPQQTTLRIHVMTVSNRADLVARADDRMIWEKSFVCGPGTGEWEKAEYREQWGVYQNVFNRSYEMTIPADSQRVELAMLAGDWLQVTEIGLTHGDGPELVVTLRPEWDRPPAELTFQPTDDGGSLVGRQMEDRRWLWETKIAPWQQAQQHGIGVMVGEFGCHNRTPHHVALAWMEDCLQNWQEAGWGWALWNLRGSFGILNSGRQDVDYEEFHGHQLDRKMLDLLLKYR
ncbi:MAG: glycoside hydrolase, partial [Planctomycetaceae bacterium]